MLYTQVTVQSRGNQREKVAVNFSLIRLCHRQTNTGAVHLWRVKCFSKAAAQIREMEDIQPKCVILICGAYCLNGKIVCSLFNPIFSHLNFKAMRKMASVECCLLQSIQVAWSAFATQLLQISYSVSKCVHVLERQKAFSHMRFMLPFTLSHIL